MEELLKDSLGTIAVLIYILYPILKRWLERRRKGSPDARTEPAEASPAGDPQPATTATPIPAPRQPPLPEPSPDPFESQGSPEERLRAMLQQRTDALSQRAARLLELTERRPELARLTPAVEDDLLGRIRAIQHTLRSNAPVSTLMQEVEVLAGLQELLGMLERIARQRAQTSPTVLGDADRMADACYAPILELARSQGLQLRTSTPVVVTGDWPLSIIPRFASTRVAPIRVPRGFYDTLWLWPALAHEVAHDLYYSVDGLADDLHRRLGLPYSVAAPQDTTDVDGGLLRDLFGAWLSEIFADLFGTLSLGPAYVETMRRAFADPEAPHKTGAIFTRDGDVDDHPPPRLRVYMATRVLHYLGRHDEAEAIWARWEADHGELDLYFLPLAGGWVGLNQERLHVLADSFVDVLLEQSWPELDGFALTNIPGFAYLHAEHAEVLATMAALRRGGSIDTDVRWIMAAAVLLVVEDPSRHEEILLAAQRAIVGVGTKAPVAVALPVSDTGTSMATQLATSVRDPAALRDAILLGEALRPYRVPGWRSRLDS